MRRRWHRTAPSRAVIAVAALYALLLQAFLGHLQPIAAFAGPLDVICAEHGEADGRSGDPAPPCQQHACCLPALTAHDQIGPAAAAPIPAAWPHRRAVVLAWQPADAVVPRAPPDPIASPRGPPAV